MSKSPDKRQPASELAAMLDAALSHDEMPQSLFDVIVDFFEQKIESTGLAATIPEISQRPVMELVLAAERRRELFIEQQETEELPPAALMPAVPTRGAAAKRRIR